MQASLYAYAFICPTVIALIGKFLAGFWLNFAICGRLATQPVSVVSKNTILQLIYLPGASL